jgi:hypothetical protein
MWLNIAVLASSSIVAICILAGLRMQRPLPLLLPWVYLVGASCGLAAIVLIAGPGHWLAALAGLPAYFAMAFGAGALLERKRHAEQRKGLPASAKNLPAATIRASPRLLP